MKYYVLRSLLRNLRNIQAEAKNCVSYKKHVICDTDQSQLSEITLFLALETELNTMKKDNLNTTNDNTVYNQVKYMHTLC